MLRAKSYRKVYLLCWQGVYYRKSKQRRQWIHVDTLMYSIYYTMWRSECVGGWKKKKKKQRTCTDERNIVQICIITCTDVHNMYKKENHIIWIPYYTNAASQPHMITKFSEYSKHTHNIYVCVVSCQKWHTEDEKKTNKIATTTQQAKQTS